jgi:CMP-N,N'-diacetyllegionaminic acid synthase
MHSLGVVLARGGSTRLPRKNARALRGIPLVAWSCRAAMGSKIDRVVLSTEDNELAEIGRQQGIAVPFVRPAALAKDFARDVDIVLHAVNACQAAYKERYDAVVMIQATTPYMRARHLDACVDQLFRDNLACVFTARRVSEHPRWMWVVSTDGTAKPYLESRLSSDEQHRQNLNEVYYPTGAAWAVRTDEMVRQDAVYCEPTGFVEMESKYSIDIDTAEDWALAESIGEIHGIAPEPLLGGQALQSAQGQHVGFESNTGQ